MKHGPVISVQKMTKQYSDKKAITGISFEVKKGEVLAILGPNGAGKTSTIEILEGYRRRTSGKVNVLGVDPEQGGRAWKSRLGMVLQSTSLDTKLRVGEALTLYARLYPKPRNINSVLELSDLTDVVHRPIGKLSGGQQRRVDVALGIIGNPDLLFLDEPTTGFDPAARRSSWQMIKNLCTEGMTIVLTTHYMEEAQVLADDLIIMADGKIIADGPPSEIGKSLKQTNTITFLLADDQIAKLPPALRKISIINGSRVSLTTKDPITILDPLISWSKQKHIKLGDLTVSRPTLEEVYLQLIHRTKREGDWDA